MLVRPCRNKCFGTSAGTAPGIESAAAYVRLQIADLGYASACALLGSVRTSPSSGLYPAVLAVAYPMWTEAVQAGVHQADCFAQAAVRLALQDDCLSEDAAELERSCVGIS